MTIRTFPDSAFPGADIRALAFASLAVSPLFSWEIATYLADAFEYGDTPVNIIIELWRLVLNILVFAFGLTTCALGIGLFLQRKSARLQPLSLTLSALIVAGLIVLLNATVSEVNAAISAGDGANEAEQRLRLVTGVVDASAQLAAVALASRLYVSWRRASPDPLDSRRLTFVFGFAAAFAVYGVASQLFRLATYPEVLSGPFGSVPFATLWFLQSLQWHLVRGLGISLLFGGTALAVLRAWRRENRPSSLAIAGVGTALAWWAATYGVYAMQIVLRDWQFPDWDMVVPTPVETVTTSLFVGIGSVAVYLLIVHPEVFGWLTRDPRRLVRDIPHLVGRMRRWRYDDADSD